MCERVRYIKPDWEKGLRTGQTQPYKIIFMISECSSNHISTIYQFIQFERAFDIGNKFNI